MPKGIKGFQKGNKIGIGNTNGFKKGDIPWNKGLKYSIALKKNLNLGGLTKGRGWNKGKRCPQLAGQNNWNWKGGRASLYETIRKSLEHQEWRMAVLKRDDFTCQDCYKHRGHNLEAHHEKPFYLILEEFLREYSQFSPVEDKETLARLAITYKPFWEISNGKTLCKHCHGKHKKLAGSTH